MDPNIQPQIWTQNPSQLIQNWTPKMGPKRENSSERFVPEESPHLKNLNIQTSSETQTTWKSDFFKKSEY